MASRWNPFRRREVKAVRVNVPQPAPQSDEEYLKALTTAARIAENTRRGPNTSAAETEGLQTDIDYKLLRQVARKSEVIDAILRRTVDDVLGNGYEFVLASDMTEGNPEQYKRAVEFFRAPNTDDSGDEWIESVIYDLQLFGDAYIELDGSDDSELAPNDWLYGGDLQGVWPVAADTMRILPEWPTGRLPDPPSMAYIQVIGDSTRRYSRDKVIHIGKLRQGRAYGQSPLLSLLKVVSSHMNLTDYIGRLFSGMLPKTLVNVGDISTQEMSAMLGLIEQQVSGGQSPYGLITVNGGAGFNIHKLIDSPSEGQFLDQLYYYREEICAVFGIPPMKLGWVQTGKLANPEQQLEAWYDVVDSFHRKLESVINTKILPLMDVNDWMIRFKPIRPTRDAERAETLAKNASAIKSLRQEGAISINEARRMLDLESLSNSEADDPFFVSPVLNINRPSADMPPTADSGQGDTDSDQENIPEESLPQLVVEEGIDPSLYVEAVTKNVGDPNWNDNKRHLTNKHTSRLLSAFEDNQKLFGERAIQAVRPMFQGKGYQTKTVTSQDMLNAMNALDPTIQWTLEQQSTVARGLTTAGYEDALEFVGNDFDINLALNPDDLAAINYFNNVWTMPALSRTLGKHRALVQGVFTDAIADGRNWKWIENQMRSRILPTGDEYPRYFYERIARTEMQRIVENSHLSAYAKMGFSKFQRLVIIDDTTDKDLCAPYENYIYDSAEARGTLPAHPNCRCSMTPIMPDEGGPTFDPSLAEDV